MTENRFKFTVSRIDAAPRPAPGKRGWLWDTEAPGLGARVTPTGTTTFYGVVKHDGRTEFIRLGKHPAVSIKAARDAVRSLRGDFAKGLNPGEARRKRRAAPTMAELWDRYWEAHGCRKRSGGKDRQRWNKHCAGPLGRKLVTERSASDIDRLHRGIGKKTPGSANRVVALLSKMFSLAERWELRQRGSNPAKGVSKFPEGKRERFSTRAEYRRAFDAIKTLDETEPVIADALRLLMTTGLRATEPLHCLKKHWDARRSMLTLPQGKTGARTLPVGEGAAAVLNRRAAAVPDDGDYLFPGPRGGPLKYGLLRTRWGTVRKTAKLPDVNLHDLRHAFASVAADAGLSLVELGGLLGHKTPLTTARYTHLFADSQRRAATKVDGLITENDE